MYQNVLSYVTISYMKEGKPMKFYLEEPSIDRKEEALEYLDEMLEYNSDINGSGGMDQCLYGMTYEDWLIRLDNIKNEEFANSVGRCPGATFFLIREGDNKIIGMLNIRYNLTEEMLKFAGHIGYGIRPTERRNGYNKINLYLGLVKAKEDFNLDKVMLGCSKDNIGSDKTIKDLGGELERCELDPQDGELTNVYWIDVDKSLRKYKDDYMGYISNREKLPNR